MKDLKFNFILPFGSHKTNEFDTIMDFLEAVEHGRFSKSLLNDYMVEATFFENPAIRKHFYSLNALYNHCIDITQ